MNKRSRIKIRAHVVWFSFLFIFSWACKLVCVAFSILFIFSMCASSRLFLSLWINCITYALLFMIFGEDGKFVPCWYMIIAATLLILYACLILLCMIEVMFCYNMIEI
jgi:hypothetical protein